MGRNISGTVYFKNSWHDMQLILFGQNQLCPSSTYFLCTPVVNTKRNTTHCLKPIVLRSPECIFTYKSTQHSNTLHLYHDS